MAALDPKQLALDNKVLLAVYVAALLPIPLWFVLVGDGVRGDLAASSGKPGSFAAEKRKLTDAKRTADTMAGRIGNADNPLFTNSDIERLEARRKLYSDELIELRKLVSNADVELEKWFDADCTKNLKDGQNPKSEEYVTEWNSQLVKLRETYKRYKDDKGVEHWEKDVATGENGEDLIYGDSPAGGQERAGQKRYWIQLAVLEALVAANTTANDPRLASKLAARIDFAAGSAVGAPTDEPYEALKVRVQLKAPFSRIPVIIRELLARKIPMKITAIRVDQQAPFRIEHSALKLKVEGGEGYFSQTAYFARVDAAASSSAKAEELKDDARWIWEPPVMVELGVEVYDFKKLEQPKPAEEKPAEEEEGGK